jgi:hypothetical protein
VEHDILGERRDGDVGRLYLEAGLLDLSVEDVDVALQGHALTLESRDDGIGLPYLRLYLVQLPLKFGSALARGDLRIREKRRHERYGKKDGTERSSSEERVPANK